MTSTPHTSRHPSLISKVGAVLAVMGSVAGLLTAIMTWANVGFDQTFLHDWVLSFAKAFFVLMPIALLLMMFLGKLAERRLPGVSPVRRNIGLGLVMSVIMQSFVAAIAAGTAVGFSEGMVFRQAWTAAFVTAFPVGLAVALLLTLVIKPRLESYLRR
ncbi:MAG: DUF2798 domain-containing protein [Sulfitobacter sp.]|uniref:DUF2798 domain-containing protein n=1 Tax=Alphaproteobacteria TaxID=28211 RepID=UPI002943E486|nr:DUF2798 domain-containing protein [Sulfitobacter sp. LC.270.F.C4]WOI15218.1 DUF2798 domain-containing protein [Sulfitobacter sp. LC.270.F.C4]